MTDLRAVFDDLVRFETVLWGEMDARLRRDSGVPLGSVNVMLVINLCLIAGSMTSPKH